ncbi:barstar family protein [Actinoplanes friuliensis]|uniref:Barstar (Barnase inhibitor) n=1 Tax=Actinoplanes friuliensis DSM 7358 TaxID=1246995 RepID=U5VTF2_9ACTN|nr:barstar family protein [Actinoplanes friuliensis]AGZ40052.1 Barstar (barnase inhibitor) [Actinoplanes friuliensis DSM 7358]
MNVVIDGRFVLNEADLQQRLAGAFGYGPYYRHDLDDLRDHLAAGDPRPVQLVWIHAEAVRLALGAALFDSYVAVLEAIAAQDEERDWNDRFVFRLLD